MPNLGIKPTGVRRTPTNCQIMIQFITKPTRLEAITTPQHGRVVGWLSRLSNRVRSALPMLAASGTTRRQRDRVMELESEAIRLRRDRMVIASESQLLTEIVSRDSRFGADRLLRRLVHDTPDAFAAVLAATTTGFDCIATRGKALSPDTAIALAREGLNQISNESLLDCWIHSSGRRVGSIEVQSGLEIGIEFAPRARKSATGRKLTLIPIRDHQQVVGMLATTELWPVGLASEQQAMTLARLGHLIVRRSSEEQQHITCESELEVTREMLILKTIMDRAAEQPLEALGEFVARLCRSVKMDRAALYLTARRIGDHVEPVVTAGKTLPPTVEQEYRRHEIAITRSPDIGSAGQVFEQDHLRTVGITTLWGGGGAWPLFADDNRIGTLVLSRQNDATFTSTDQRLMAFGSNVLAKTLRRIYYDAAIRRQARHDGLTDLANRRAFDAILAGEVDRVRMGLSEECSLLLADMDRFKAINDHYGHQAGDEVLRLTARLLQENVGKMRVGERSLLARYGGEELAILLPGVGMAGALRIAEEIRGSVEQMVVVSGEHQFKVTVSIGVATCPRHGMTVKDFVAATDSALYQAKREGRNRVCSPLEE